jgi:hypothetical protein
MQYPAWLKALSYLAAFLQEFKFVSSGLEHHSFNEQESVESFIKKQRFWDKCFESSHPECLDTLHDFPMENKLELHERVKAKIAEHLRGLGTKFSEYFPALSDSNSWLRSFFDDTAILHQR